MKQKKNMVKSCYVKGEAYFEEMALILVEYMIFLYFRRKGKSMNTYKLMATDLGKAYFITWTRFDRMIDGWAKNAIAKHVQGEGIREDREVYIHIEELTEADKTAVASLCLKYDAEIYEEYEDVGNEFVFPSDAILPIVRECIGEEISATTNHLLADEYGVYLFENHPE